MLYKSGLLKLTLVCVYCISKSRLLLKEPSSKVTVVLVCYVLNLVCVMQVWLSKVNPGSCVLRVNLDRLIKRNPLDMCITYPVFLRDP